MTGIFRLIASLPLTLALASLLILFPGTLAAAAPPDLDNHWARAQVVEALHAGWVSGDPDGRFRPDHRVTRAEFVRMIAAVRGLPPRPGDNTGLRDVGRHWVAQQGHLGAAAAAGIVAPDDYYAGRFGPDEPITRQEMGIMAVRALAHYQLPPYLPEYEGVDPLAGLKDRSAIPRWAQPFVAAAVGTGAMRGYPDGSFGGQRTATRAEAVTLLHRLKEPAGREPETASPETLSILPVAATPLGQPQRVTVELRDGDGQPCRRCWLYGAMDPDGGTVISLTARDAAGRQLTVTSVYLPESDGRESIWDGVAVFEVDPVMPGVIDYQATGRWVGKPLPATTAQGRAVPAGAGPAAPLADLSPEDVRYAVLRPLRHEGPYRHLEGDWPEDRETLARLVGRLQGARLLDDPVRAEDRPDFPLNLVSITIFLRDGRRIIIQEAFRCQRWVSADGSRGGKCDPRPDRVLLHLTGRGEGTYAESAELAGFLAGGYRNEMPSADAARCRVEPETMAFGEPFTIRGQGWLWTRTVTVFVPAPGPVRLGEDESPNTDSVRLGTASVHNGRFVWRGRLPAVLDGAPSGKPLRLDPGAISLLVGSNFCPVNVIGHRRR